MVTNCERKSYGTRWKNSKICSDDRHRWHLWFAFRHFGTHLSETFRMSISSWMMDPTRSREMPSCSAIDLAEIRRSSKISSWIWPIISGVVNVLDRPERGASQVGNSPRLTWTSVTRKDLQFDTWTDPLSNDTIDSVLRYWEVVRVKDLSAPPLI